MSSYTQQPHFIADWLDSANAQLPAVERHIWLLRLMDWIRQGEPVAHVQYLVHQLRTEPARRDKVLQLLAATWRDVDVTALLADYGFAAHPSFLHELGARLRRHLLPLSPETADLGDLFDLLFDDPDDAQWIERLDNETLVELGALFSESIRLIQTHPLGWREAFYDAVLCLATDIRSMGFSQQFRPRIGTRTDTEFDEVGSGVAASDADRARLAFQQVSQVAERLHRLAQAHAAEQTEWSTTWPDALLHEARYLRALLDECAQAAQGVHGHLEQHGISIDIVFQIELLQQRCERISMLLDVVLSPHPEQDVRRALVELVAIGSKRRSVRELFTQHYSLLARKVAERSAETGENYITRNRAEYVDMLWRAAGGGAVLAGTTFMKFVMLALGLSPFWTGFAAGANYAISFVIVQWLHFTVATKQPAMTAPAMAAKLVHTQREEDIEGFVDEVAHLIRSQMAGIIGNLAVVGPLVLVVQLLAWWALGRPLLSETTAHHTLDHLTLLGPTAWYAAFTGVLLFLSSLVAGWVENWFVLNRLDSALRWNPRIRLRLGAARAERWATWWRQNISGLAANISLGFMLGLVPVIAQFLALPLDVRHVTLSTGQWVAAGATLGWGVLHDHTFWWGAAAIPITGLLNVGVSFALALRVAIRSRGVRVQDRGRLWRAMGRRLWRRPWTFLWPPSEIVAHQDRS
ncbi:MAG TPA: recombinase [Aquabacterium sp.]|nr:recombinase [Aquabacterium sp.]